jgi:nucleotide-binding universal stress UspA family protein
MQCFEIMDTPRTRIVVGIDLSEYSPIVLEHAFDQAARHIAPDLHILTVVEDPGADLDDTKTRLGALVLPALDGFDCGDWRARIHVRAGRPHEEIVNLAAEIRAHLVVIGSFGLHHKSVASRTIDVIACPTLVVPLNDQSPDHDAQCPDCVMVRIDSDGERWFCPAHANGRASLFSVVVPSALFTGGSLMW